MLPGPAGRSRGSARARRRSQHHRRTGPPHGRATTESHGRGVERGVGPDARQRAARCARPEGRGPRRRRPAGKLHRLEVGQGEQQGADHDRHGTGVRPSRERRSRPRKNSSSTIGAPTTRNSSRTTTLADAVGGRRVAAGRLAQLVAQMAVDVLEREVQQRDQQRTGRPGRSPRRRGGPTSGPGPSRSPDRGRRWPRTRLAISAAPTRPTHRPATSAAVTATGIGAVDDGVVARSPTSAIGAPPAPTAASPAANPMTASASPHAVTGGGSLRHGS